MNLLNNETIPIEKLCDYKEDCSDKSDEKNCGTCLFQNHDRCGYNNILAIDGTGWHFSDEDPQSNNGNSDDYISNDVSVAISSIINDFYNKTDMMEI